MNWLAHLYLLETDTENRLGNLLGDLVKGREIVMLNCNLKKGVDLLTATLRERHYAIDTFTDTHEIVKISKRRMGKDHARFSGVLIDVFYDHFLAKNWASYSQMKLSDFTAEIYKSFQSYPGEIPAEAQQIIQCMIKEDWLTSYQYLDGIDYTLKRIEHRIKRRSGRHFFLVGAMEILKQEYVNLDQDFQSFFPDLQQKMQEYSANR
jgi:acyl carrier protein phosphodiesterase